MRFATPWPRVALAGGLLVAGFGCAVTAAVQQSLAAAVAGALMLVPGAWAARVYLGVLCRGEEAAQPRVFFDEVEVGEEGAG